MSGWKERLKGLWERGRKRLLESPWVSVGMASCGRARGAERLWRLFREGLSERFLLRETGCFGDCFREPVVSVYLPGKPVCVFTNVDLRRAERIRDFLLEGRDPFKLEPDFKISRLFHPLLKEPLCFGSLSGGPPEYFEDPFFERQHRLVLRNAGLVSRLDLSEYVFLGGFLGLLKAEELGPERVLEELEASGLRGRGGAGFPTGLKWRLARQNGSPFLICNADEGDPGAYMNRNEIESDPFSVLEGMLIASVALRAERGFFYIRDEYPLATETIRRALEVLSEEGFFEGDFGIEVAVGGGAFVCGEETALIASIEGRPGRPRPRPPYPVERGLFGRPTVVNNVETWTNVAPILLNGGRWFSELGTAEATGTKVFSVVGDAERVGLVEVPLGTPLETLAEVAGASDAKACQVGGPSGGCIPKDLFDLPLTYEGMKRAGAIMGSGGVVFLGRSTCMVEVALYFVDFCLRESCGKCVPCREGLWQLREMLYRVRSGRASREVLDELLEVGKLIAETSLCGLGTSAPNPVLTALRYFRSEFEEHLEGRCPTGRCLSR